jgi:RNA polymerase sigma-70 factor (ECF subfamily)
MTAGKESTTLLADSVSDEVLVQRCGRGDEAAFQALYERHNRMIYNLVFRMLGNHADAEEVTPDVFVKVWLKAEDFRGQSRVSTWMYRIAANMSLDHLRSARSGKEVFWEDLAPAEREMPDIRDPAETPEDTAIRHEDQRALADAMARLSPEDRLFLSLYHLQGCSYLEIEQITGVSPVNIKSRLFRARRRLRDVMVVLEKGDAPDDLQRNLSTTDGLRTAATVCG